MKRPISRRDFVIGALGGLSAGSLLAGILLRSGKTPLSPASNQVFVTAAAARITTPSYIAIDYAKCTGCRICEIECVLFHEKTTDLTKSRIKIYSFPNRLDVASLCASCGDAPCIKACPPEASALSRNNMTGAVILNEEKCIACWACVDACSKDRSAVIRKNRDAKKVVGICDLCSGDPVCVKACPESCLTLVPVHQDGRYFALKPATVAASLRRNLFKAGGVS